MTNPAELSEPVQDGSADATRAQKIAGLARQVASDLALKPQDLRGRDTVLSDLRLRLSDAGIAVDEDELRAIADTITAGD